ncbi:MAG: glycogen synthase, partial [Rubrivivax sp.]
GMDLLLAALPEMLNQGVQLAVQGTGDPALEAAFRMAEQTHQGLVQVHVGYDEARAHRLVAGADVIAVPSRFEPCGLAQLYAMRYGTLPVVRRVGGLADTVQDADDASLRAGAATGFVFDEASAGALAAAVGRLAALVRQASAWRTLQRTAMTRDFSWRGPARRYLALYGELLEGR